ncbi:putative sensor histidine kinase [Vibrio maritimus]|uniref:Putative sensor histidine kinase n=1 Tax=Vibrio maritimus TaxID=990268 RepID=A0A090T5N8_9VIBR|nr:putative sensor histidine kinase [Vibrio maritimus]
MGRRIGLISRYPCFEEGEVSKFIAVERDITERKNLELALAQDKAAAISDGQQTENLLYLNNHLIERKCADVLEKNDSDDVNKRVVNGCHLVRAINNHTKQLSKDGISSELPSKRVLDESLCALVQHISWLATNDGFAFDHVNQSDTSELIISSDFDAVTCAVFNIVLLATLQNRPEAITLESRCDIDGDELKLAFELVIDDEGHTAQFIQELQSASNIDQSTLHQSASFAYSRAVHLLRERNGYEVWNISEGKSRFNVSQTVTIIENLRANDDNTFRVLIAEDNKVNTIVLTKLMKSLGYESIDTVINGEEALESAKNGHYNLVLMDNHMPKMSGLEATKHLKQEYHVDSAIIACTADTTEEATQAFLAYGASEVIYKPLKKEQLLAAIQRSLSKDKENKAS